MAKRESGSGPQSTLFSLHHQRPLDVEHRFIRRKNKLEARKAELETWIAGLEVAFDNIHASVGALADKLWECQVLQADRERRREAVPASLVEVTQQLKAALREESIYAQDVISSRQPELDAGKIELQAVSQTLTQVTIQLDALRAAPETSVAPSNQPPSSPRPH